MKMLFSTSRVPLSFSWNRVLRWHLMRLVSRLRRPRSKTCRRRLMKRPKKWESCSIMANRNHRSKGLNSISRKRWFTTVGWACRPYSTRVFFAWNSMRLTVHSRLESCSTSTFSLTQSTLLSLTQHHSFLTVNTWFAKDSDNESLPSYSAYSNRSMISWRLIPPKTSSSRLTWDSLKTKKFSKITSRLTTSSWRLWESNFSRKHKKTWCHLASTATTSRSNSLSRCRFLCRPMRSEAVGKSSTREQAMILEVDRKTVSTASTVCRKKNAPSMSKAASLCLKGSIIASKLTTPLKSRKDERK